MDLIELLKGNWINLCIIFIFPLVGFISRRRKKIDYLDNMIKYADMLEKVPQESYKTHFLNNIKKKLLWEKVCFYQTGNPNREKIAIALVNADTQNKIHLPHLNELTNYFSIQHDRLKVNLFFQIPDIIMTMVAFVFAFFVAISNLYTIFHFAHFSSVYIAFLTLFVLIIAGFQFGRGPVERILMFHRLLCDDQFLSRANQVLNTINETESEQ